MTTKEFIEILEDVGFSVKRRDTYLSIRKNELGLETLVASVSTESECAIDTRLLAFEELPLDTRRFLLTALCEYSSTPLDERESIELSEAERVILESLDEKYDALERFENSNHLFVTYITDKIERVYTLFMFHDLFKWIKPGEIHYIADLLND